MMDEEVAANAVGGGGVDGIGVGPKGEPGVNTLAKWPFPGIGMPSMFRRKAVIRKRKSNSFSNHLYVGLKRPIYRFPWTFVALRPSANY